MKLIIVAGVGDDFMQTLINGFKLKLKNRRVHLQKWDVNGKYQYLIHTKRLILPGEEGYTHRRQIFTTTTRLSSEAMYGIVKMYEKLNSP
jgi:hypothetical protein